MTKNFYIANFQNCIMTTMEQLRFINQEMEILEYREKLNSDPELK